MGDVTQVAPEADTARRIIGELRRGRKALALRVAALTEDDLARQSACTEGRSHRFSHTPEVAQRS